MSFVLLGILNSAAAGGAAGSYDLLETTVLTSPSSSVSFTNLASTYGADYRHLQIRTNVRADDASETNLTFFKWNGVDLTYGNELFGYQGSVSSGDADLGGEIYPFHHPSGNSPSGTFNGAVIDIFDFAGTSRKKTFRSFSGQADTTFPRVQLVSGFRNSISALDSIQFVARGGGNYVSGSRFSLYGIKAG